MARNIVVYGTGQDGGARAEQRISNIYITHDAPHIRRSGLSSVVQCAGTGAYRPEALRHYHDSALLHPPVAGS